jgi:LytS/YehU family sensor histidine kinase
VPDALRACRVPPFLLQPLVENAIKHGVAAVSGPVFIRIAARQVGDEARIEVVDSGGGFDYPNGSRRGLGLQLTERRLRAHSPLGVLSVERRADGFAVVVSLPA